MKLRKIPEENGTLILEETYNIADLMSLIVAVEKINTFNDGKWSDWEDAHHIFEIDEEKIALDITETDYGKISKILDRAIETNGNSLPADLREYEREAWGTNHTDWINVIEEKYRKS